MVPCQCKWTHNEGQTHELLWLKNKAYWSSTFMCSLSWHSLLSSLVPRSGTFLVYSYKAALWIQETSPILSDVECSVVLRSVFAIGSTLAYLLFFQECATPPHVQLRHTTWLSFTRPSPALVLQATNAGAKRPGYEANSPPSLRPRLSSKKNRERREELLVRKLSTSRAWKNDNGYLFATIVKILAWLFSILQQLYNTTSCLHLHL